MAFVPFQGVVKAELVYTYDSQICENVLHYSQVSTPDVVDMIALADALKVWWNTSLKPLTSSNVSLITIRVTSQESVSAPAIEYTTDLPIAGTGGGVALPNNVTVCTKFITAFRGRSFRGRVYHVGLTTSNVNGNKLASTYRNNLRNAWEAASVLSTAPVWTQVVASRVSNGIDREEGLATTVTGAVTNEVLDSQRRRLPDRGQ